VLATVCALAAAGYGLQATEDPARAEESVGEVLVIPPNPVPPPESFAVEIPHPVEEGTGEIQTRGLGDNLACGTYLIRSKADNAMLHLNGLGDRLVSTRWQPNDDYVRFILELQQDGSVRIKSKATGQYLYEEVGGDRLVSTRQVVNNDPRTNVWLEPALNGSVRIKSAMTRQYWHYNGLGDRLISSRWQTTDSYASFTLERVTGPTAVAACTTDVLEQVLAKEFYRAVFDRQANLGALLQATDTYLASNPIIRTLAQGAPIVNLNATVRQYLAKYPQGSRQVKIAELQAIAAQIQAMKANAAALSAALTPTSAGNATAMANAQSGLASVQAAIENLATTQRKMRQWGQARLRNLTASIRAAKGGGSGPVVAVFGKSGAAVPQIQSRAVPAGAVNVALNKTATQSSTPFGQAGSARVAIDGNTNGQWTGGSVTHTDNQLPWWEVDLGAVYDISTIRIWNRTDCCRERLTQFRIVVGETPIVANDTRTFGGGPQSFGTEDSKEFTSTANTRGRYVRIMQTRQDYLSLAEVEVFGTPAVIPVSGSGNAPSASTSGTEFVSVPAQSAVVEQGSTIVVVTETSSGLSVSSIVGAAQQYQQALQASQASGHPTGNPVTPIVITAPSPDSTTLFEYARATGAFDQLELPAADLCSSGSVSKADAMWDMSAGEGCVEPEPELTSYSRGAGKPLSCASGQVQSGALCYEPCQAGYTLVAGVCWQSCPSGYRDDGAFCAKPGNYTREKFGAHVGEFTLDKARARCNAAHPTVGCEKQGLIIYEKCKSGYKEILLDWCGPTCPSDMGTDIGVSCTKKTYSNPTPWGKPLSTCASGMEKEGQLCYTQCKTGYHGSLTQCLPD
jgi:hypothetical protein